MQKSAARPMKRIPKATEIRLNAPTISKPAAAVTTKPTHRLTKHGEVCVSRAQRQPEDQEHREHGSGEIGQHPLSERHELLVVDHNLSGQPHPCAKHWAEFQLIRRLPDRVYRRAARLQGAEIEFWLDLDEAPRLVWCCGLAIHQHP